MNHYVFTYHLIISLITYNLSFPYKMILKERAIGPFCLSYIKSMTYYANHKNIDMHKHASNKHDYTPEKISLLSVYNLNFIFPCTGEYYNILPVFYV